MSDKRKLTYMSLDEANELLNLIFGYNLKNVNIDIESEFIEINAIFNDCDNAIVIIDDSEIEVFLKDYGGNINSVPISFNVFRYINDKYKIN